MAANNASGYEEWQPNDASWDDGTYYTGVAEPERAPARGFLQRVWTGRPMVYILAAGLIGVTALVILTRPGAEPDPAPAPVATPTPFTPITYDAGPVIDNEFNKP